MNFHRIELVRGVAGSNAHPAIKQAIRFARRLRERGLDGRVNFLSLFLEADGIQIEVGRRVVRINNDGEIRQEIRPTRTSYGWRADPQGMPAHRARMHVVYLKMASSARYFRHASQGRIYVDTARMDRVYRSIV